MDQTQEREFFDAFGQKMGECAREAASRNAGLILKDLRTAIAAAEQMGEDPVASGATELTAVMKMEISHPSEGKALVRVRSFAWTRKTTRCDKDFDGEMVDMRQPDLPFEDDKAPKLPQRTPTRYELQGKILEALPWDDPKMAEAYAQRIETVERLACVHGVKVYCPVMTREEGTESTDVDKCFFATCCPMEKMGSVGVAWRLFVFPRRDVTQEVFNRQFQKDADKAIMYDLFTGYLQVELIHSEAVQEILKEFPRFFVFRR